ncbi:hypothetical protein RSOLAG1IB_05660 [Rhizoctonia solani AG-1 IB]|uniref:Tetratricopeptide repeat protein n=1 Tax=Thanatephorus cucumeris (strain AG1-IB / isolate 7/3/14) TaxID=1108050 RepID=A0A0B7G1P4_THACB|nr:hypothetical protein RSOLAG1IB_05660 [Rhizoctonia solani AG-1 IB]
MFDSQLPDKTLPSVIGEEEASFLELKAGQLRETNPDKARSTLVAAALGYLCHGHRDDAYTIQIQIGWILIDQQQFRAAQAHFDAVERAVDGDKLVASKRGLARAAVGFGKFDEALEQYSSALALCRAGRFTDYEYMITREMANAILDNPRNQGSPEEALRSQNRARQLFKEALSFSMDPEYVNLEYQAQVRCGLVQLERNAGNELTAQSHAFAAFRCALETERRTMADEVYNYLLETNVLSEAQCNAFRMDLLELHTNTAHIHRQGVDCE